MKEIKEGEYVRTPYNTIEKIERIYKAEKNIYEDMVTTDESAYGMSWLKIHNTKHSFDIIDLIEKDDYINGCRVYKVEKKGITVYQKADEFCIDYGWIPKDEIKSIVTKEQFKSMEYKVGE